MVSALICLTIRSMTGLGSERPPFAARRARTLSRVLCRTRVRSAFSADMLANASTGSTCVFCGRDGPQGRCARPRSVSRWRRGRSWGSGHARAAPGPKARIPDGLAGGSHQWKLQSKLGPHERRVDGKNGHVGPLKQHLNAPVCFNGPAPHSRSCSRVADREAALGRDVDKVPGEVAESGCVSVKGQHGSSRAADKGQIVRPPPARQGRGSKRLALSAVTKGRVFGIGQSATRKRTLVASHAQGGVGAIALSPNTAP